MAKEKTGEGFQRRIAASFKQFQLVEILEWYGQMDASGHGQETISEVTSQIEDEKQRKRYQIGLAVITGINEERRHISDVHEVLVWQIGPGENDYFVEYKFRSQR